MTKYPLYVWDRLWVLILSVPELSLHINLAMGRVVECNDKTSL